MYFSLLNQTDISYAITGRTENYPEHIHSDIDIIIPHAQYPLFWKFMRDIEQHRLHWIQTISHESTAFYNIVTFSENNTHHILKPDVCSDYYRNGKLFLHADYLLKNRVFNQKGFFLLYPEKEFIYYFLKKVDKQSVSEDQFSHLYNQWKQNKNGCNDALNVFFSEKSQLAIANAMEVNDISLLNAILVSLQKELHSHLKFNIKDYCTRLKNRFHRIMQPTGFMVAFMGPDGCGKTTIIDGVKNDLTEIFRQNRQYHLFPKNKKDNAVIVTDPHSQKARGYLGSVLKLFYFLYLYTVGYWGKVYPLKIKSTFIIFDRYFHDLMVDPKRYRDKSGLNWLKFIAFFIPKPDLWILLDAPAEVIQKRKAEVPFTETARQILAYKQLFSNLKNTSIVNADQHPDKVIYDVEKIIIDYLGVRTKKRYKNI
jgi:thymidylate kinase